ncbi:hypothetical protein QC761_0095510 [Podospora bellae-mahoneyi]|uniref:Uncharacterized protein n=1 Tax=Podospora bellae-mahoneyi TaxID=2093777 RepID=A0ABR0FBN1_9PEZI|nr:hypothetical protein QC761_0095510 [Podospora bellae-mahoneyi]
MPRFHPIPLALIRQDLPAVGCVRCLLCLLRSRDIIHRRAGLVNCLLLARVTSCGQVTKTAKLLATTPQTF